MSSSTLMPWQPRTWAKHTILQEYLKGWFPILSNMGFSRLLYVDAFAADGEYRTGEAGSPILAIKTAVEAAPSPEKIRFKLADERLSAVENLNRLLKDLRRAHPEFTIDDAVKARCDAFIEGLLEEHRDRQLGPAFFFLDQFGYSEVPILLIKRILSHSACETFNYLNWHRMHPYFTDTHKAGTLNKALGSDAWREVIGFSGFEREQRFKALYVNALKEKAKARYVYPFEIRDKNRKLIHWFFFSTNNLKGLEVMKKAMWKVDGQGRFQFSEADIGQTSMFAYTQEDLAKDLHSQLLGKTLSAYSLREHVLVNTPHYIFGDAIKLLRSQRRVEVDGAGDLAKYTFVSPPPQQTQNLLFGM